LKQPDIGHNAAVKPELELAEYKLLCQATQDACRELRWGHVETGRRYLLDGLERAAELTEEGEAWADRLADEYRTALREFDQLAAPYLERLREYHLVAIQPEPSRTPRQTARAPRS
jgi:hypothetical protein